MSRDKSKRNNARSTRELLGIRRITDHCIVTWSGDLAFFCIQPTNLSVLPDASVSARIQSLLHVLKGQAEMEMMAMDAAQSFDRNKAFYQQQLAAENVPALCRLLEQDCKHLDRIQTQMASARELYLVVRLHSEKEPDIMPYLSRIEKTIKDNGFLVKRAGEQDLKHLLAVYFEQDVTNTHYGSYDGDQWDSRCASEEA